MWAVGGLWFVWLTGRYSFVSVGYRWLGYAVWGSLAALAASLGVVSDGVLVRDTAGFAVVGLIGLALLSSLPKVASKSLVSQPLGTATAAQRLNAAAIAVGLVGLVAAGLDAGTELETSSALFILRIIVGALFLGAVTSTMLLGHWYLVQPGMSRQPLLELTFWAGGLCLADAMVWLVPTGMISVMVGAQETSGNALLGWFWLVCVLATAGLLVTTRLSLTEPRYSAVMAATGVSYLAIMTAFAMELVARAGLFG